MNETDTERSEPPPKRRTWLWVLFGVIGLGGVMSCLCCGVGGYYLIQYSGMVFAADLQRYPPIAEKTGMPDSVVVNFGETMQRFGEYPEHVVYDVEGPRGSAQIMIKPNDEGGIEAVYLIEDGEVESVSIRDPAVADNGPETDDVTPTDDPSSPLD